MHKVAKKETFLTYKRGIFIDDNALGVCFDDFEPFKMPL